jgi:hypothetical protein
MDHIVPVHDLSSVASNERFESLAGRKKTVIRSENAFAEFSSNRCFHWGVVI